MKTTADFRKMKLENEKITMVTAYDAPSAKLVEEANLDVILVGDSLGMVVLGYDSTVPVTVDDMVHHTKAVKRGAKDTFVVTDMPFLSYHGTISETIENVKKLVQDAGADAVKMEGGGAVLETAKLLIDAGVPVVAHLGLTPQTVGVLGGYKVQGKNKEDAEKLLADAKKAEASGVSMLVLECVPEELAGLVTETLSIPVIGIGAGRYTDGQVLVFHDLIGYTQGHVPKFVKRYGNVSNTIQEALKEYNETVKHGKFPEEKHVFQPIESVQQLYGGMK
ncbi:MULTISPECIES: 3-methyl-2-oxobutanoate hydroxymethyltransferase [Bacillaceae]|uniref:3-methyl-2-oxobutanoate hydroxymethyltransferase n=1 Tax=Evansella alkalicola TaxID=745819 RepID=A0ABS6JZM7_9BACI|nr:MULTISPECIES: 3-methyl-2-oxobutanoate hydroxymethyltransferase [Bacillaceae]MBU9723918.1 3-methyl-2-oxobutanoate hydroxymethyltransferase [Bacillus alkalicola]